MSKFSHITLCHNGESFKVYCENSNFLPVLESVFNGLSNQLKSGILLGFKNCDYKHILDGEECLLLLQPGEGLYPRLTEEDDSAEPYCSSMASMDGSDKRPCSFFIPSNPDKKVGLSIFEFLIFDIVLYNVPVEDKETEKILLNGYGELTEFLGTSCLDGYCNSVICDDGTFNSEWLDKLQRAAKTYQREADRLREAYELFTN